MYLEDLHKIEPIAGALHLKVSAEAHASPDLAAVALGIEAIGDSWREIDRNLAEKILEILLREDMAYNAPRLSENQTTTAISEFLSLFSEETRYFTNGNWEARALKSKHSGVSVGITWMSATQATFDGGVIAIDTDRSGILWLEDED